MKTFLALVAVTLISGIAPHAHANSVGDYEYTYESIVETTYIEEVYEIREVPAQKVVAQPPRQPAAPRYTINWKSVSLGRPATIGYAVPLGYAVPIARPVEFARAVEIARSTEIAHTVEIGRTVEIAHAVEIGRPGEPVGQAVSIGRPTEIARVVEIARPVEIARVVEIGQGVDYTKPRNR